MEKPTIFFSHSSKDRDAILPIKEKLMKITSGVIQIFMSSDGQSIPFGNNWVHKIEEGLNNAKIMFVFVTPTSIESGWIYFEAGFAYSKGIDVIPVGVGVDIGSIKPPLSLLQGFNITSGESLNNFVTVINKNFDLNFETKFNEKDFQILDTTIEKKELIPQFNDIFTSADYIVSANKNHPENYGGRAEIQTAFDAMQDYLKENDYKISIDRRFNHTIYSVLVNGLRIIQIPASSKPRTDGSDDLKINMSMFSFEDSFELFKSLIIASGIKNCSYLRFLPNAPYGYVTSKETLSAIAYKNPDLLLPDSEHMGTYHFCNTDVAFTIYDKSFDGKNPQYVLSVGFSPENTTAKQMVDCIENLINIGVITKNITTA